MVERYKITLTDFLRVGIRNTEKKVTLANTTSWEVWTDYFGYYCWPLWV